jgi:iron complex outermembrane receptor protein
MMPGVMNTAARTYTNTDARLYGGELNMVVPLEDRLFVSGSLSYVRGVKNVLPEKGILSTNVAEIPPLSSRLGFRYDDGRFVGLIEGILSSRQESVDLDLQEEETPSWGIMNLQAGLRRGKLTASVGIGNVFNQKYYEHLSYQRDPFRSGVRVTEPGRNIFVNLGIGF